MMLIQTVIFSKYGFIFGAGTIGIDMSIRKSSLNDIVSLLVPEWEATFQMHATFD